MPKKKLRVDIITIFPEICESYFAAGMLGRAQRAHHLDLRAHNLRQWTHDRYQKVDDTPFGGGPGMILSVEPFDEALQSLHIGKKSRIILTSAKGKLFTQADARRLATFDRLVFLCGRYEGVDERVAQHLADEEISIGPYVLTGGELPALVMTDAIARLRPGVLGKAASLVEESWGKNGGCEYPQYTRPEVYRGWKVPKILLSGNHAKIAEWRRMHS